MKATLSNGTVLEGEPKELAEAIKELSGPPSSIPSNSVPAVGNIADAQVAWKEKTVGSFWNCLYGGQKKLMQLLLKKPGASVEDIKNHLGLKTGNQVAGLLSCITRNARRETGFDEAMAYSYELKEGGWHYSVRPEVVEILKKMSLI
jgi:hypothetical protein